MIGYNTLYKSMNGIKVVSDGISFISEGVAQHDDIIYNNSIISEDNKTIIKNDNIKTEIINCNTINTDDMITKTINADDIQTKYFKVIDSLGKDIFLVDGAELKALSVDTITQKLDKGITQSGNNVSNNFGGTTQIKNLVITDSITFPSTVEIPGTTTTDDIIMNGTSVIKQDITNPSDKFNNFRDTKTLHLSIGGNIIQTLGNGTAFLKNTTIQGLSVLEGDITQTAGTTVLKTLRCNNITLNDDQIITMSGTGYITQSGTGNNLLKTINMISNANINQTGGIISQTGNNMNSFTHYRTNGIGIISGKNGTGTTHTYNCHNVYGIQFQYGRTSDNHCYIISNKNTSSNGAIRFQRYTGGLYVDEPLVIGDEITMNKNLSIPGGSLSCSSATIGIISQEELNTLENINYNIKDKFTSLDEQISNITSTNTNNNLSLTGISYNSSSDTTTIDNNLIVNKDTSLLNLNVSNNTTLKELGILGSVYFRDVGHPSDATKFYQNYLAYENVTFNNRSKNGRLTFYASDAGGIEKELLKISTSGINVLNTDFFINNVNILSTLNTNTSNINTLSTNSSGITYNTMEDSTVIDNNLTVNKNLIVQNMNIKQEIENIQATYTTGTITTSDLKATNITITNTSKFGENGSSTFFKNDLRFVDVVSKNENTFSQLYHSGNTLSINTFVNNGKITFTNKNSSDELKENLIISNTSVNVKNTPLIVDSSIQSNSITSNTITSNTITTNTSTITRLNAPTIDTTNINLSNDILFKDKVYLEKITDITSNIHLEFPLSKTYLFKSTITDSDQLCILPAVPNNNYDGITFEFVAMTGLISLLIKKPDATSKIVNNYGVEYPTGLELSIPKVEYIKFMIRNREYVVIDTKQREFIAGYMLDGTIGQRMQMTPIICSTYMHSPDDVDDAYLLNTGYSVFVCSDPNYSGNGWLISNETGCVPKYFVKPGIPNMTSSLRVYYKGFEIRHDPVS